MSDKSVTIPVAWSVTGNETFTIAPRTMTRRGAMQWAVQFVLEHPGSLGVILGTTVFSLDQLIYGIDGLDACLYGPLKKRLFGDGYITSRQLGTGYPTRASKLRFQFPINGSQIIAYPTTVSLERLDGLNINFVVVEQAAANGRTWEALTRRIRPLPGVENCIIYITDEADE